jgi:hypothetical protein
MLALLGERPPGNYQQFIDKGVNEKFVYLSNWNGISPVGRSLLGVRVTDPWLDSGVERHQRTVDL